MFDGPLDDPEVDVLATKVVRHSDRETRIELYLSGRATSLTTTVQSVPAMPEGDVLALLVTGRTLSELTNRERGNVYGAAISLGVFGARGLAGSMRVGAAIRLNRNLYFRYTYGAFSRLGGALLRYRLNKRISLQAQTGDTHSIEVRYGVD